ncbi:MAG: DUF4340 domain-containing protein [Victivallales bacterium]|nr:DUF4340 domain-containing protein [Victivallales bacterium]
MKKNQLLKTLLILIVLGAIAGYLHREELKKYFGKDEATAEYLLPEGDVDLARVKKVMITSKDKSVTLEKNDGWKVVERYGYPANMDNLDRFITSLFDCRILRAMELSDELKADMKLTDETGAVTVKLMDGEGQILRTLVCGVAHEKESDGGDMPQGMMMMGGGNMPDVRFILMTDGRTVLVPDTLSSVDSPIASWLDKEFFKIGDMKTVELLEGGKSLWKMARGSKSDDLKLDAAIPDGKEVDSSKISSVKSAFSWMRFNDVADPAAKPGDIGMDKAKMLVVKDFDDFTYTLAFGATVGDKRYLKLEKAEWDGETVRKPADGEKPEDKAKLDAEFAAKVKENQGKAAEWNAKFGKWIYEVGTYSLGNVDHVVGDFFKDKTQETKAEDKK